MQAGLSFRLATCCFSPLACSATRVFHPTGSQLLSLIIRQPQPSAHLSFATRKAWRRSSHRVLLPQAVSPGLLTEKRFGSAQFVVERHNSLWRFHATVRSAWLLARQARLPYMTLHWTDECCSPVTTSVRV